MRVAIRNKKIQFGRQWSLLMGERREVGVLSCSAAKIMAKRERGLVKAYERAQKLLREAEAKAQLAAEKEMKLVSDRAQAEAKAKAKARAKAAARPKRRIQNQSFLESVVSPRPLTDPFRSASLS